MWRRRPAPTSHAWTPGALKVIGWVTAIVMGGAAIGFILTTIFGSGSEGRSAVGGCHRDKPGQALLVQDVDAASVLAFHETVGFQPTQRPVHHHAARADHGCQVGSLGDWMRRIEDNLPIRGGDGRHTLARRLEGPLVEPHVENRHAIR